MATFPRGHWTSKTTAHNDKIRRSIDRQPKVVAPDFRNLSEAYARDKIVMQLISRDGDRCYLCLRRNEHAEYWLDHIIPRAHGGTDHLVNLALSCATCNIRKSDRIVSFTVADRIPCYSISRGR